MPSSRHRSKQSDSTASSSDVSSSKRKHASRLKLVKIKRGGSGDHHHRHHRDRRKTNKLLKSFSTHNLFDTTSSSSSNSSRSSSDEKDHKHRSKIVVRNQNRRRSRRKTTTTGKVAAELDQDHQPDEEMDVSDVDTIDLRTPVNGMPPPSSLVQDQPVVTVTTNNLAQLSLATATAATMQRMSTTASAGHQTSYKSRTLTSSNSERHLILPAFPTSMENDDDDDHYPDLLLANVPDHLLSDGERNRRRSLIYRPTPLLHIVETSPNNTQLNSKIPSFFWSIYQELFVNVAQHLQIDMTIIDYNYTRLSKCIDIWAKERILRFRKLQHEVTLDQREYPIALEFYLQIDNLFYMKTCSFRHVQPHESQKHLFCLTDPVASHEMTACGNCGLCYPKYDVKKRRQPSVDFGLATRRHQFVNKYETILNCPCSCKTSNIIYVLTCPCGKFDYIGESGATLADRIEAHRFHGNRIMHETFLGPQNIKLAQPPGHVKSVETLVKDVMYLYRHSTECQSAIQMFLDANPRYWRFVPMTNEEANQPEQSTLLSTVDVKFTDVQDENKIRLFIQNLPAPPPNYRFSSRQYHLQYAFFKSNRYLEMPNTHLDLYNAKIIAVLPETGSTVLRQIVESLFITHTETKLNSSGRLVGGNIDNDCRNNDDESKGNVDDHNVSNRHQNAVWCEGLLRRPLTSIVEATTTTTAAATTIDDMVSRK